MYNYSHIVLSDFYFSKGPLECPIINAFKCLASLSAKLFTDLGKLCMDYLAAEYAKILLYFSELQKTGDFPRQFQRPHMKETNQRSHHDMKKSQASRRNTRWPQEKKETTSRNHREREKHRKANRCYDVDEDFPRGPRTHSSLGTFKTQKPHKSFHHSHQHKPEDKLPREGRRGKRKKKERCMEEEEDDDNLFLIKQRKKKSRL